MTREEVDMNLAASSNTWRHAILLLILLYIDLIVILLSF